MTVRVTRRAYSDGPHFLVGVGHSYESATMLHSPLPWKLVRSDTPYGDWIMSADGGMVAGLFGRTDEALLLAAPLLLAALSEAAVAMDQGRLGDARAMLAAALMRVR